MLLPVAFASRSSRPGHVASGLYTLLREVFDPVPLSLIFDSRITFSSFVLPTSSCFHIGNIDIHHTMTGAHGKNRRSSRPSQITSFFWLPTGRAAPHNSQHTDEPVSSQGEANQGRSRFSLDLNLPGEIGIYLTSLLSSSPYFSGSLLEYPSV